MHLHIRRIDTHTLELRGLRQLLGLFARAQGVVEIGQSRGGGQGVVWEALAGELEGAFEDLWKACEVSRLGIQAREGDRGRYVRRVSGWGQ